MFLNIFIFIFSLYCIYELSDKIYFTYFPFLQFIIIFNISILIYGIFYNIYFYLKYNIKKNN